MLKQFVPGRLTSPDTFTLSQSNPSNQTEQQQQPDNMLFFHWIFYCMKLKHQNVPLVLIRSITPLETETVTSAGPRPHLQYDILAPAA